MCVLHCFVAGVIQDYSEQKDAHSAYDKSNKCCVILEFWFLEALRQRFNAGSPFDACCAS